jgi:hypothetical protein
VGSHVLHYAPEGRPYGALAPADGGEWRLYDLARDPEEREDLAARDPERARALREELLRRIGELEARRAPRPATGGDAATQEMLRGLGYIGDEKDEPSRIRSGEPH